LKEYYNGSYSLLLALTNNEGDIFKLILEYAQENGII